jgi:hypothetical protein
MASVKQKDMKPITVEAREMGARGAMRRDLNEGT